MRSALSVSKKNLSALPMEVQLMSRSRDIASVSYCCRMSVQFRSIRAVGGSEPKSGRFSPWKLLLCQGLRDGVTSS